MGWLHHWGGASQPEADAGPMADGWPVGQGSGVTARSTQAVNAGLQLIEEAVFAGLEFGFEFIAFLR